MGNIFDLFKTIKQSAEVGDYRGTVCNVGKLMMTVACQSHAEATAPGADERAPVTVSPDQLRAGCVEFCEEFAALCERNESIVQMGQASDAALPPGSWQKIAAFLLQVLQIWLASR